MGGLSSEREVSLSTGNAVVEAMIRKGLKVFPIDVDRNIANNLKGIDLAFNALTEPMAKMAAFKVYWNI